MPARGPVGEGVAAYTPETARGPARLQTARLSPLRTQTLAWLGLKDLDGKSTAIRLAERWTAEQSAATMPGAHATQIVADECAAGDRVKRGELCGTVTSVRSVSDGPNGICTATEVTIRWDEDEGDGKGGGGEVRLNPMALPGDPACPAGVVFWQPPDEQAAAGVLPAGPPGAPPPPPPLGSPPAAAAPRPAGGGLSLAEQLAAQQLDPTATREAAPQLALGADESVPFDQQIVRTRTPLHAWPLISAKVPPKCTCFGWQRDK